MRTFCKKFLIVTLSRLARLQLFRHGTLCHVLAGECICEITAKKPARYKAIFYVNRIKLNCCS